MIHCLRLGWWGGGGKALREGSQDDGFETTERFRAIENPAMSQKLPENDCAFKSK